MIFYYGWIRKVVSFNKKVNFEMIHQNIILNYECNVITVFHCPPDKNYSSHISHDVNIFKTKLFLSSQNFSVSLKNKITERKEKILLKEYKHNSRQTMIAIYRKLLS